VMHGHVTPLGRAGRRPWALMFGPVGAGPRNTKTRKRGHCLRAPGSPNARQNRRNRQISPVVHMSFRAPTGEKWRPTSDLAGQTPREAAGLRKRKVWQPGVMQSTAVRSEHGEMALSALEKAPFSVVLHHFFDDLPRVFLRARA
jgi:hypothetical protein